MFYIYILYSKPADRYYVGYTSNVEQRLAQHNFSERTTYTSKHRPWKLKAIFKCGINLAEAVQIERFIKKQKSKKLIEKLLDPSYELTGVLAQLVRVPHVRD